MDRTIHAEEGRRMSDSAPVGETAHLTLTLRYPPDAFLYAGRKPRVLVQGVPVPVTGWGEIEIDVAPGERSIEVWVPYLIPRRAGRVRQALRLQPGERKTLEYVAPMVTFRRGALGDPGTVRSGGANLVRSLNLLVLVVFAVGALIWLGLKLGL